MENIIKPLRLFNEKATKLERLSFIDTLSKYNSGVSITFKKNDTGQFDITQERRGPLEEAIDAFVLTIRFFIQDNESISLRNIASIYESSLIKDSAKSKFKAIRDTLNKYLDSNSGMAIIINEETLNHRKIMDVMIYGGLSHANKEKKKQYDFWVQLPLKAMIENDFVSTLAVLFAAIKSISDLNTDVINELTI